MKGRWTIHKRGWGHLVAPTDPTDQEPGSWPVVPCDDAAIEKAEIALIGAPYDWRSYGPAIVAQIVLMGAAGATDDEIAEFVLRAAGETS